MKKGETGIRILAPIVRKVDEEKNGTTEKVFRPFGVALYLTCRLRFVCFQRLACCTKPVDTAFNL